MGNDSSRHRGGNSRQRNHHHDSLHQSSGGAGGGGGALDLNQTDNDNQLTIRDDYVKPQRRMDKLRRSLSFRRTKKSKKNAGASSSTSPPVAATIATQAPTVSNSKNESSTSNTSAGVATSAGASNKPTSWQDDERKVRDGTCSFHVKYLGSIEVADSRGMEICEQAIEKMLLPKKKPIKAILYVSGDALRVVDETNKTLLVDQTIEKVSFCAPDRFHENGFAYICRDGTTRRWLCHGFMAIKDTIRNRTTNSSGGERLSHAVGCAFSVCLEKKQKRERVDVSMEVGQNYSFTRFGSFRQASLTERLEDPQSVIPGPQHVQASQVPIKKVDNPFAIERPRGNTDILNRQNSLRAAAGTSPFKRNTNAYSSLKPAELPSVQQQKLNAFTSKLAAASASATTNILDTPQVTSNQINTINEVPETESALTSPQAAACAQPTDLFDIFNTPPPLPPMPAVFQPTNDWQPFINNSNAFTATPVIIPPPLPPMPQQHTTMANYSYTTSIFPTPQSPPQTPSTRMYTGIAATTPHYYATTATPTTATPNETFEAKWARLQANKKTTNPFAEDIAKKFEIKL